jgi:hypothetical protein
MEPEELAREHPEEYRTQYQRSIPESEMRPPP